MKAVFSVTGAGPSPQPSFDIVVCFNGVPGEVVLEIHKTDWSAEGDLGLAGPAATEAKA